LVPNSLNFLTKIFYNFDPKIVFSNCRRFFVGFPHKKVSEKVEKSSSFRRFQLMLIACLQSAKHKETDPGSSFNFRLATFARK
jgi:hypothetical protein